MKKSRRGWVIAIVAAAAVFVGGLGVAGYYAYRTVSGITKIASGAGSGGADTCPTEQAVSEVVGEPVTLAGSTGIVVASGCSYLATDREAGADVQITTGPALAADSQFDSVTSDAATQGVVPVPIPVGDRAAAFGSPARSDAIAVSGSVLIEVEVFNAGATDIGDKKQEAITLLQKMIDSL